MYPSFNQNNKEPAFKIGDKHIFEAGWKENFALKNRMMSKKKFHWMKSNLSSPSSLIVNAAEDNNELFITNGVGEPVCIHVSFLWYLKEGRNE